MRRVFNGEFIIMRNLRVAVIKFVLAFIESAITHPSESKDARLSLASCSVLQLAILIQMYYLIHFNTCALGAPMVPGITPPTSNTLYTSTHLWDAIPSENSLPYPPRLNSPLFNKLIIIILLRFFV